jgi:pimeloyl-[acyl-carrier protein] methyl ester esterase
VDSPTSILLPGLDGSAKLFAPFVAEAPAAFPVRTLPLPNDRPRTYRALATWAINQLPPEPFALIAESFSGPLALLIAAQCPQVTAIVLCASFVDAPLPRVLSHLPQFLMKRLPPTTLVSWFLTGGDRSLAEKVRTSVSEVDGEIIAHRIDSALQVDVTDELKRLSRPLFFIRAQQDGIIPRSASRRARELKPSANYIEIEAPHLLLQTRPKEAWGTSLRSLKWQRIQTKRCNDQMNTALTAHTERKLRLERGMPYSFPMYRRWQD